MYLNGLQPKTKTKTATKLKLFVSHSLEEVENDLNEWLAQEGINISHVAQSQSERGGKFVFVISVFYQIE